MGASLSQLRTSYNSDGGTNDAGKILTWLKQQKGFLVFMGNPGIGKTHFCAALIPWVYSNFVNLRSFRYWTEREFIARIRSSMNLEYGDWYKEVENLTDNQFLVYDDLGSTGFNEWRREVIFSMIDMRYNTRSPTVITTNLSKEEIVSGLGGRGASRLFAKENLIIENLNGDDLRKNGM